MNTAAWKILAQLLDVASEEFSNHICNDLDLPNTPENCAIVMESESRGEVVVSRDGKTVYANDAILLGYFARLAKEFSGEG